MTIECKCGWRSDPAPRRIVIIAALDHMLTRHPETPEIDRRLVKARNILAELEN